MGAVQERTTTLRASAGVFYNWLNAGVYEQTLRVDGFKQQELIIDDPDYPVPSTGGTVPPVNRYQLNPDLKLPRNFRISAGIDQALTSKIRLAISYSRLRFSQVLRGQNMNAPVNGVRPEPAFANVIEVTSDGQQHSQQVQTNLTVNLTPKGRAADGLVNWRRANLRVGTRSARLRTTRMGRSWCRRAARSRRNGDRRRTMPPSRAVFHHEPGAAQSQRDVPYRRQHGLALQRDDRARQQRRSDLQRSPGGPRPATPCAPRRKSRPD